MAHKLREETFVGGDEEPFLTDVEAFYEKVEDGSQLRFIIRLCNRTDIHKLGARLSEDGFTDYEQVYMGKNVPFTESS